MPEVSEAEIIEGLHRSEFILYYQPKASLITNRIVGAEALARWRRQDGSVLTPASFLNVIEDPKLLQALTLQLLGQLIHDMNNTLGSDIRVSFNVCIGDFEDDILCEALSAAIQRAALPRNSQARKKDGFPQMNVTSCALGRWYVGEGRHFGVMPIYQAIDAPHREVHRIGESIIDQIRNGATLTELTDLLSALKAVSTTLIRLLEDLEDAGFHELYRASADEARHPPYPAPGPAKDESLAG